MSLEKSSESHGQSKFTANKFYFSFKIKTRGAENKAFDTLEISTINKNAYKTLQEPNMKQ